MSYGVKMTDLSTGKVTDISDPDHPFWAGPDGTPTPLPTVMSPPPQRPWSPYVQTHAQALATFPAVAAYIDEYHVMGARLDKREHNNEIYNHMVDRLAHYKFYTTMVIQDGADHDDPQKFMQYVNKYTHSDPPPTAHLNWYYRF